MVLASDPETVATASAIMGEERLAVIYTCGGCKAALALVGDPQLQKARQQANERGWRYEAARGWVCERCSRREAA